MLKNLLFLLFPIYLISNENLIPPDGYTKEGYCLLKSKKQKYLGLLRFSTKKAFLEQCKGYMIFVYENDNCKTFTMKNMKFNIYINDGNKKELFKIGEKKSVCSKTIIESLK